MSDFRTFQGGYGKRETSQRPAGKMDEQSVADFAKQYDGKKEGEILSDLLAEARRGKENGTFDIGQIEAFAGTLRNSGMFDANQLKRLDEVMKLLKKD